MGCSVVGEPGALGRCCGGVVAGVAVQRDEGVDVSAALRFRQRQELERSGDKEDDGPIGMQHTYLHCLKIYIYNVFQH